MSNYNDSGVFASQISINGGVGLRITYSGLLYKNGAQSLFTHYGYGAKWTNIDTVSMTKADNGFSVDIPLPKTGTINLAFKDDAENWDNNSGSNYSIVLRAKK